MSYTGTNVASFVLVPTNVPCMIFLATTSALWLWIEIVAHKLAKCPLAPLASLVPFCLPLLPLASCSVVYRQHVCEVLALSFDYVLLRVPCWHRAAASTVVKVQPAASTVE